MVPDAEVQKAMVALFGQVQEDLHGQMLGLESVFWKLIIVRDMEALGDLATAVSAFNNIKEVIALIVQHTRELPIHQVMLSGADLPTM